jgi:bifunctional non-homologous end joining protein LigD
MRKRAAAAVEPLRFVEFQLPTLVETPPEGPGWIHEIKYDGYRTELLIQGGTSRATTRRAFDWSAKYPGIVEAAARLPVDSAAIDGEVIVIDEKGRTDFATLRSAIRWQPQRLVFVAFDIMHLDGNDLTGLPLLARRAMLQDLVRDDGNAIQFSHHIASNGAEVFKAVDELGLEGMVSKRSNSPCRSGRGPAWLKTKCFTESVYEVAGVLREPGRPAVAYLVTPDKQRKYVGGAFITLNQELRERLWSRVRANAKPVKGVEAKPGTELLKPGLVARVRYLKGEQTLRHATLQEVGEL